MLVKEIAYKFAEAESYLPLPIRQLSGTFKQLGQPSRQGTTHTAECAAYIPSISSDLDNIMFRLAARGAIFLITDNSFNRHELGSDTIKAVFKFEKKNDGRPGGLYGYDINITFTSAVGIPCESFTDVVS